MDLTAEITKMASSLLAEPSHFLVDVVITGNRIQKKVVVMVDGDQGVTIEDCAKLSRGLSARLDEVELIKENYTLEITTPGVDTPLKLKRQYKKNIGRELKVTLKDKTQIRGKLTGSDELSLQLQVAEMGSKKNQEIKTVEIPFDSIDKALVQISFK